MVTTVGSPTRSPSGGDFAVRASVVLLLAIVAPQTAGQPPQLDLLDLSIPPSSEVQFREGRAKEEAGLPFDPLERPIFEGTTPSYRLIVDMTEMVLDDIYQSGYRFPVYVVAKNGSGRSFRYIVKAEVLGSPHDSMREIGFSIGPEGTGEEGRVRLPVYSPRPVPYVKVQHPGTFKMKLGGEGRYPITLTSELEGMPAWLRLARPVRAGTESWSSVQPSAPSWSADEMVLTPQVAQDLTILARVKTLPALLRGFLPTSISGPHDVLHLDLEYRTRGGHPVIVPVDVDVQFVPSVLALIGALLLGVLLGNVIVLLFRRPGLRKGMRMVTASAALAFVVWVVALLLFAAHSRVQMFGLDINPLEVVGTILIGALIGLNGKKALHWFEYMEKRTQRRTSAGGGAG